MGTRKVLMDISQWHKTVLGLLIFAIIELVLAYGLFLVAVDRGTLWWYVATILLLIGVLQNVSKLIWKVWHVLKSPNA